MPVSYCARFTAAAVCLLMGFSLHAQKKDSTWVGAVHGSVRDSALNYFMEAATVSVYRQANSSLLAYTMTNTRGEYTVGGLPHNVPLEVKISYIGYGTFSRVFTIPAGNNLISFGETDLLRKSNATEDSVVVTPPPVRMHGDTLEFSAAAFSLDKNAVAEDLLKNLPGVIIWGDGTITVNGKQISKLLVDGKPFFGADAAVATQNIPKSAIDKVQVYQENINPDNPYDSITTINLKLRKSVHSGYFGMFSAGAGSDNRYEASASSSAFSPRDQLALAGQANNVNQLAGDLNTLLKNSTYKGVGARVEYQPDFNLQGSNQPSSGGLIFAHDFIPEYNNYKQNRLSVNSYVNHNLSNVIKSTQAFTAIGIDSSLEQDNMDNMRSDNTDINIDTRYSKVTFQDSLTLQGIFDSKRNNIQNQQQNEEFSNQKAILSSDHEQDSSLSNAYGFSFKSAYGHHGLQNAPSLSNWGVKYSVSVPSDHLDSSLKINFNNTADPSLNRYYDRLYNNWSHRVNQNLSAQLGDFASWLFHDNRTLSRFQLQFRNDLQWNDEHHNNQILDRDPVTNVYDINPYLSKISHYDAVIETPKVHLGRSFLNVLANRYQKEFHFFADAGTQFYYGSNSSTHSFQNYTADYRAFLPGASLGYSNFQYGEFLDQYNLDLTSSAAYPNPDQRFPLVDSSNIYNTREGNPELKPTKKYELSAKFRHDSYRSGHTLFYGLGLAAGITQNYVADSVVIDLTGRYAYYPVNLNGNRFIGANLFLSKAFVFGVQQLQLNVGANMKKTRTPGYLGYTVIGNTGYNLSQTLTSMDTVSLYYTYKNIIALNLTQSLSYYGSKQYGFSNVDFVNVQSLTRFGVGLNITKKLTVNTNLTYNWSSFSNTPVNRYTIWNAYAAYRFLSGNNLEMKLSALDLLNENKGIINTGSNYTFTHGTVNMLHQYFMATLTWYPRKFGKRN